MTMHKIHIHFFKRYASSLDGYQANRIAEACIFEWIVGIEIIM